MWRLCWLERETSPLGSHIWTLGPLVIWGGDMASLKDVCHRGVRFWGSFFSPTSCVLSLLPVCVSGGSFRFLLWPQTAFPSLPLWTLSLRNLSQNKLFPKSLWSWLVITSNRKVSDSVFLGRVISSAASRTFPRGCLKEPVSHTKPQFECIEVKLTEKWSGRLYFSSLCWMFLLIVFLLMKQNAWDH